jgi:hypothetical protein
VRPFSSVEQVTPVLHDGEYVLSDDGTFAAHRKQIFPTRSSDHFFATIVSGAQRLSNGNMLLADGPHGRIVEVDAEGATVWEFENPHYTVRRNTPKASGAGEPIDPWWMFRALRYASDDPAVALLDGT